MQETEIERVSKFVREKEIERGRERKRERES